MTLTGAGGALADTPRTQPSMPMPGWEMPLAILVLGNLPGFGPENDLAGTICKTTGWAVRAEPLDHVNDLARDQNDYRAVVIVSPGDESKGRHAAVKERWPAARQIIFDGEVPDVKTLTVRVKALFSN